MRRWVGRVITAEVKQLMMLGNNQTEARVPASVSATVMNAPSTNHHFLKTKHAEQNRDAQIGAISVFTFRQEPLLKSNFRSLPRSAAIF